MSDVKFSFEQSDSRDCSKQTETHQESVQCTSSPVSLVNPSSSDKTMWYSDNPLSSSAMQYHSQELSDFSPVSSQYRPPNANRQVAQDLNTRAIKQPSITTSATCPTLEPEGHEEGLDHYEFDEFEEFFESPQLVLQRTLELDAIERERRAILTELRAVPPFPVGSVFLAKHKARIMLEVFEHMPEFDYLVAQAQLQSPLPDNWNGRERLKIPKVSVKKEEDSVRKRAEQVTPANASDSLPRKNLVEEDAFQSDSRVNVVPFSASLSEGEIVSSDSEAEALIPASTSDMRMSTSVSAQGQFEAQLRSTPGPRKMTVASCPVPSDDLVRPFDHRNKRLAEEGHVESQKPDFASPLMDKRVRDRPDRMTKPEPLHDVTFRAKPSRSLQEAAGSGVHDSESHHAISTSTTTRRATKDLGNTAKPDATSNRRQSRLAPSEIDRTADCTQRVGRRLFSVQVQEGDHLHSFPIHEVDDPALIAREICVKFGRTHPGLTEKWGEKVVQMFHLKKNELLSKTKTRPA